MLVPIEGGTSPLSGDLGNLLDYVIDWVDNGSYNMHLAVLGEYGQGKSVFVTTFAGMRRPSDMLDAATWTWPVPILVLATASTARFCCRQRVPAWLLLLVLLLSMHFVEPSSPAPWK